MKRFETSQVDFSQTSMIVLVYPVLMMGRAQMRLMVTPVIVPQDSPDNIVKQVALLISVYFVVTAEMHLHHAKGGTKRVQGGTRMWEGVQENAKEHKGGTAQGGTSWDENREFKVLSFPSAIPCSQN